MSLSDDDLEDWERDPSPPAGDDDEEEDEDPAWPPPPRPYIPSGYQSPVEVSDREWFGTVTDPEEVEVDDEELFIVPEEPDLMDNDDGIDDEEDNEAVMTDREYPLRDEWEEDEDHSWRRA